MHRWGQLNRDHIFPKFATGFNGANGEFAAGVKGAQVWDFR